MIQFTYNADVLLVQKVMPDLAAAGLKLTPNQVLHFMHLSKQNGAPVRIALMSGEPWELLYSNGVLVVHRIR